jgi:AcrR family transcriptional regulator
LARTRAEDYEDKRSLIFDRAAELFAERGFARTSIAELAAHCRASKSWIYHYFPSKEAILYEILRDHVETLRATAERALGGGDPPKAQLRALLRAFLAIYARAKAKQVVLLNELGCLPEEHQREIRRLERQVVDLVVALLHHLNPELMARRSLVRPTAMLLFGMINWTHTWYRPDGALKPDQLAELVTEFFLHGIAPALATPTREPPREG